MIEIEEAKLQEIIKRLDSVTCIFTEKSELHILNEELKALIEPKKWEPKEDVPNWGIGANGTIDYSSFSGEAHRLYGNEWPTKELATIARDMNKRNQLILQAKHEIGAEDGQWEINYAIHPDQVIKMLGLND